MLSFFFHFGVDFFKSLNISVLSVYFNFYYLYLLMVLFDIIISIKE